MAHDALNRMVTREEDRVGAEEPSLVTRIKYDGVGNVTEVGVTEVGSPVYDPTSYSYDSRSRLKKVHRPVLATPTTSYEYDERGRLETVTNSETGSIDYEYYPWGDIESVTYDDPTATSGSRTYAYVYDENGNIKSVDVDAGRLYDFVYDEEDRVSIAKFHQLGSGMPRSMLYHYTIDGAVSRLAMHDGHTPAADAASETDAQLRRYDSLGRLETLKHANDDVLAFTSYFADDSIEKLVHGNQSTTTRTRTSRALTDFLTVAKSDLSELHKLDYGYDTAYNVDDLKEWVGGAAQSQDYSYNYDDFNRLGDVTNPGLYGQPSSETFKYDAAGNRSDQTGYLHDANDRMTRAPGPPVRIYDYDLDGNMTEIKTAASVVEAELEWDAFNRLVRYKSTPGGSLSEITTYAYDPFGRRIEKARDTDADGTADNTTRYVWSGDQLAAEFDLTARKAWYEYADGWAPVRVAYGQQGSETAYDVHSDRLGTPRLLTDEDEAVVWRAAYGAYGEAFVDTSSSLAEGFNIRFPGQYYDEETGLHYNRFRYYDPGIGRYISADPIGQAGGVNLYRYAGNSPTGGVDPLGLILTYGGASDGARASIRRDVAEARAEYGRQGVWQAQDSGPVPRLGSGLTFKPLPGSPVPGPLRTQRA